MIDRDRARGERHLERARPEAALAAFTAALKRDPRNPSLWLRVADAAFLSGRAAKAAEAAARAHELAPGDERLRRALQARLLAGDEAGARRALAGRAGAEAEFWRGVLAARAARWSEARRRFLAAAGGDPARLAERAGLFAAWAGHRAAGGGAGARGRGLVIAGLGWKRPRQATVGALDALAGCRHLVAVANTLDDATRDLLCLFRAGVSAVSFRGTEAEATAAARVALAAAAKGPAGTVTRGNPLVYGRFAARLVALARARGTAVRVLPGVSGYEDLAAAIRHEPGAPLGLEVRGSHDADAAGARALAVFTPSSPSRARLPRRPAVWSGSEAPAGAAASRVSAAEATSRLARGGAPGILYYAPRAGLLALLLLAWSPAVRARPAGDKADKIFAGHQRGIAALAVSPDGTRALTGSEDRTVKLWDLPGGKLLRTFTGHTDYVFGVAFSADGRLGLSGSQDGTARLWDLETGRELREFSEPGQVFAVAFSPDGKLVLTGGRAKVVTLWNRATGAPVRRLEGHTGTVLAAAFTPDGKRVLTSSQDATLRLWDAETGKTVRVLTGQKHWVLSLAISRDGKRAVSGGFDKNAMLWDLETGKVLRVYSGHTGAILGVALSPDGTRVLSGGEDKTARLWDADSGRVLRVLRNEKGDLCCVGFSDGGREALTASDDGVLRAWSLLVASSPPDDAPPAARTPSAADVKAGRARVELGKLLFFDPRLSGDKTVSCSTCHDPAKGWSDGRAVSRGIHGALGRRNALTVVDASKFTSLFWDGRAATLEDQSVFPLVDPDEMGSSTAAVVAALSKNARYGELFEEAFGAKGVTAERVAQALASFERTLVSGPSTYDRWLGGEANALSPAQRRGKDLFSGKASCFACHSGAQFSDFQFHNIGVNPRSTDPGRFALTGAARDRGAFRTPSARNLSRTAPYMHDGSLKTLEEVVEFYDKGGNAPKRFDFEIQPLGLTAGEKKDLVAFLRALDGDLPKMAPPKLP